MSARHLDPDLLAAMSAVLAAATLVLATLLAGMGRRLARLRDAQFRLASALDESVARGRVDEALRLAVRDSGIGIYDYDHVNSTVYCSAELRRHYGFSPDEPVTAARVLHSIHPQDQAAVRLAIQRAEDPASDGCVDIEYRTVRGDGEVRRLIARAHTVFSGADAERRPQRTIGAVIDITEAKQTDAELQRLNTIHRTLSYTNQLIVRADSEAELFGRICDIAVEYAGFALVWIGLLDEDGFLRMDAVAGPARAYVEGLRLASDERLPEGRGPAGLALRSGAHVIVNDVDASELMRPWLHRTREFGLESSAAFPLFRSGRVCGILSVHSTVKNHFREREISLLDDMAADISFGLESLDRKAALNHSQETIRDIEATLRMGALRLTLPDWSIWWSDGTPAVLGLSPGALPDRGALESSFQPEISLMLVSALEESAQGGGAIDIDLPLRDGSRWIRLFGVPRPAAGGRTELSCRLQDISDRKRLEAEVMTAAESERRRLASELHDNLGQTLYGTSLLLGAAAREAHEARSALCEQLDQTVFALNEAMQVCRTLAHGAAPIVHGGLSAALRELAAKTAVPGVRCFANVSDSPNGTISDAAALELYRIAQEALTNALKHARCRHVELRLSERPKAVELEIRDDGAGFDVHGSHAGRAGIGLRTMRYRAARAGGALEVRSAPGHGTRVRVLVPFSSGAYLRAVGDSAR